MTPVSLKEPTVCMVNVLECKCITMSNCNVASAASCKGASFRNDICDWSHNAFSLYTLHSELIYWWRATTQRLLRMYVHSE